MVFRFLPREEKFFEHLIDLCGLISSAVNIVQKFFQDPINSAEKLDKLADIERNGQEIASLTVQQLHSSFITPFDREDILLLTMAFNKVLGYLHGLVKKHILYETIADDVHSWGNITAVLISSAQVVNRAVPLLKDIKKNSKEIITIGDLLLNYKAEGDSFCREAICSLFCSFDNAVDIIRWKELYEHLEDTLEAFENVGSLLREIAVKYV